MKSLMLNKNKSTLFDDNFCEFSQKRFRRTLIRNLIQPFIIFSKGETISKHKYCLKLINCIDL